MYLSFKYIVIHSPPNVNIPLPSNRFTSRGSGPHKYTSSPTSLITGLNESVDFQIFLFLQLCNTDEGKYQ